VARNNFVRDGKPQAGASNFARDGELAAIKSFEEMRDIFRWNPDAGVAHLERRGLAMVFERNPNLATFRREFSCVAQQIVTNLKQLRAIGKDHHRRAG